MVILSCLGTERMRTRHRTIFAAGLCFMSELHSVDQVQGV